MSKLENLIKQNKREREMENCKKQFSKLLKVDLKKADFLPIEQTDFLTTKFYDSFKCSENKVCKKYLSLESGQLEKHIKTLCVKFSNTEGYLITKQTQECGLLKVPIEKILEKYEEVIELDGDSLCILTIEQSEGIYLDYFEENVDSSSLWYYELCCWQL